MDKIFDTAKSIRDINQIAADLLRIGLKDKIRSLAGKYRIPETKVDDYLQGKRYFLIDEGNTAGMYKTARAKLLYEMEMLSDKNFGDVIGEYLLRCCDNSAFDKLVLQNHKTLQRCIEHLMKKALAMVVEDIEKPPRQNVSVAVTSDSVFGWSKEYYALDDKEAVAKAVADEEKRIKGCKSVPKKPDAKKTTKQSGSSHAANQKKSGKAPEVKSAAVETTDKVQDVQVEGQFSLFNM